MTSCAGKVSHSCWVSVVDMHVHVHACSGPCMTLVLTKGDTGEGVVDEIRELIGPTDVEQAKENAPDR